MQYLILLTHIKRDVGDLSAYIRLLWLKLTRSVISILALVLTPITIVATGWAARRENKP
jgi:hypothetical protein